jgi:hypothetical protein
MNSVISYLQDLWLKYRLVETTTPFPIRGNRKPKTYVDIVYVAVELKSLLRLLPARDENEVLSLLKSMEEKAYECGAREIRVNMKVGLNDPLDGPIPPQLQYVFLGEKDGKAFLAWFSKNKDRTLFGEETILYIQDFENQLIYEAELLRLEAPKA